jgi:hypothetical protein
MHGYELVIIFFIFENTERIEIPRTWMYSGWQCGKAPSSEWTEQTTEFLDHAFSLLGRLRMRPLSILVPCVETILSIKGILLSSTCVNMVLKKAMKSGQSMARAMLVMMIIAELLIMRVSMKFIA